MTRVMLVLCIFLVFLFYLWDEVIDQQRAAITRTFRTFGIAAAAALVIALSFTGYWKVSLASRLYSW